MLLSTGSQLMLVGLRAPETVFIVAMLSWVSTCPRNARVVRDYGARDCKQEHVVAARDVNSDQRLALGYCAHPHSCLLDAFIVFVL